MKNFHTSDDSHESLPKMAVASNARLRSSKGFLTTFAELTVVVAAIGWLASAGFRQMNEAFAATKDKQLQMTSYATVDEASFFFTNEGTLTKAACARGVLTSKKDNTKIMSFSACSGQLPPGTTAKVVVPWAFGKVKDICGRDTPLGRMLSWDDCTFEHVEETLPR